MRAATVVQQFHCIRFHEDMVPELPEAREEDPFPPRLDDVDNKCDVDLWWD